MKEFERIAVRHRSGKLEILDQRLLPQEERWLVCDTPQQMVTYIYQLSVRGAPLIGVCAALALAKYAESGADRKAFERQAQSLKEARPTAINLMNALDRMLSSEDPIQEAEAQLKEEIERSEQMGKRGAALIAPGEHILTHCNTGALATPGIGTALAVIIEAHRQGKKIHVFVDETRPLLQGGRLTTYELKKWNIPYTLICDNMAAVLMREGRVQRVLLGADRIALNGDFANKIGSYSAAVNAHYHGVAYHTVAPISTIDVKCPTGRKIPVEQRNPEEVRGVCGAFGSVRWSPEDAPVFNPSFDVTPVDLLTSMIMDVGVFTKEELKQGVLARLCKERGQEICGVL